ncbi:MAG: hypothetical protein JXR37_10705 [Kiritimatiellae bacterium]|nr:hypothetical protein [Kiritimatiellia bacterium]
MTKHEPRRSPLETRQPSGQPGWGKRLPATQTAGSVPPRSRVVCTLLAAAVTVVSHAQPDLDVAEKTQTFVFEATQPEQTFSAQVEIVPGYGPTAAQQLNKSIRIESLDGVVQTPKVLVNDMVDGYSLKTLIETITRGCRTDAEKAYAIYLHTTGMWISGGTGATDKRYDDPVVNYNNYFYGMCYDHGPYVSELWAAAGFKSRDIGIGNGLTSHRSAEVFYDGDWHCLDPHFITFYLDEDNHNIASVRTIGNSRGELAMKAPFPSRAWQGEYLAHATFKNPDKDGWAATLREPPRHNRTTMDFTLAHADAYTRYAEYNGLAPVIGWSSRYRTQFRAACAPSGRQYVGSGLFEFMRDYAATHRRTGNGELQLTGCRATSKGIAPDGTQPEATAVWHFESPNPFVTAWVDLSYAASKPGAVVLDVSDDKGVTWRKVAGIFPVNATPDTYIDLEAATAKRCTLTLCVDDTDAGRSAPRNLEITKESARHSIRLGELFPGRSTLSIRAVDLQIPPNAVVSLEHLTVGRIIKRHDCSTLNGLSGPVTPGPDPDTVEIKGKGWKKMDWRWENPLPADQVTRLRLRMKSGLPPYDPGYRRCWPRLVGPDGKDCAYQYWYTDKADEYGDHDIDVRKRFAPGSWRRGIKAFCLVTAAPVLMDDIAFLADAFSLDRTTHLARYTRMEGGDTKAGRRSLEWRAGKDGSRLRISEFGEPNRVSIELDGDVYAKYNLALRARFLTPEAAIQSLRLRAATQLNPRALPLLKAGDNTIRYSDMNGGRSRKVRITHEVVTDTCIQLSDDEPAPGEQVLITGKVTNRGSSAAEDVRVRFYDGNPNQPTPVPSLKPPTVSQIGRDIRIPRIAPGQTVEVNTEWKPGRETYEIHMLADPQNALAEPDEDNNLARRLVTVWDRPDLFLVPGHIRLLPSAANGPQLEVCVPNKGQRDAIDIVVAIFAQGQGEAFDTPLMRGTVGRVKLRDVNYVTMPWRVNGNGRKNFLCRLSCSAASKEHDTGNNDCIFSLNLDKTGPQNGEEPTLPLPPPEFAPGAGFAVEQDADTLLYVSYDRDIDADRAKGDPRNQSPFCRISREGQGFRGRHSLRAARFRSRDNIDLTKGTVRFAVRNRSGEGQWRRNLLRLRWSGKMYVTTDVTSGSLTVTMRLGNKGKETQFQFPFPALNDGKWHTVRLAWDTTLAADRNLKVAVFGDGKRLGTGSGKGTFAATIAERGMLEFGANMDEVLISGKPHFE